ncbi:MAG: TonB family protein [Bacteroidales bacterium]|nr:TonB family protein [Bacteroidales bacterium]
MTEKRFGIIGTIIFHNIILLILLLFYLSTPKPVTSGGGILIDFGNTEFAGGEREPGMNEIPEVQTAAATQQLNDNETEEDILTQDFEEAPAVKKKTEKKSEEKKPVVKPSETKIKATEKPVDKTPQVNKKALYSAKGKSTQEDGTSQGMYKGNGNQGSVDGTPGANNYGEGSGTGSGTGLGIQVGGGLENRRYLALPKPEFKVQKEGKVVVEVTVNREGKVISATPGVKGTTIVDLALYAAAKKAALESRFVTQTDAQAFQTQTGTITYHFKLE